MAALQAAKSAPEDCEVYPENWGALMLFNRLQTCWRVAPMGGLLGLSYPDVDVVMRRAKVEDPDAMFEQIQWMELAVLDPKSDADHG